MAELRLIRVDGQRYRWRVVELDERAVLLRVWHDGHKRQPWFEVEVPFDNPWYLIGMINEQNRDRLALQPVTPGRVAALVRAVRDSLCLPTGASSVQRLRLEVDGELTPAD